jgi:hypothetical protein
MLRTLARTRGRSREAVDPDQLAHQRAVRHGRPIPLAGERLGVDLQRFIRSADVGPAEIGSRRPVRRHRHDPTMRIAELWPLIGAELDRVSVLVNMPVVQTAHKAGIQ